MNEADVVKGILAYQKRAEHDDRVDVIPLEHEGVYEAYSGDKDEYGSRNHLGFFRGRFVDVLAHVIQQPGFGGWYTGKNPDNSSSGYVNLHNPEIMDIAPVDFRLESAQRMMTLQEETAQLEERLGSR